MLSYKQSNRTYLPAIIPAPKISPRTQRKANLRTCPGKLQPCNKPSLPFPRPSHTNRLHLMQYCTHDLLFNYWWPLPVVRAHWLAASAKVGSTALDPLEPPSPFVSKGPKQSHYRRMMMGGRDSVRRASSPAGTICSTKLASVGSGSWIRRCHRHWKAKIGFGFMREALTGRVSVCVCVCGMITCC